MKRIIFLFLFVVLASSGYALDFKKEILATIPYGSGNNQIRPFHLSFSVHNVKYDETNLPIELRCARGKIFIEYSINNNHFIKQYGKDFKTLIFDSDGKYIRTIRHPEIIGQDVFTDEAGDIYIYGGRHHGYRNKLEVYDKDGKIKRKVILGNPKEIIPEIKYEKGKIINNKTQKELLAIRPKTVTSSEPKHRRRVYEEYIDKSDPLYCEKVGGLNDKIHYIETEILKKYAHSLESYSPFVGIVKGRVVKIVAINKDNPTDSFSESPKHFLIQIVVATLDGSILWSGPEVDAEMLKYSADIDDDGNIYLAIPGKNDLKIIKWSIDEESK